MDTVLGVAVPRKTAVRQQDRFSGDIRGECDLRERSFLSYQEKQNYLDVNGRKQCRYALFLLRVVVEGSGIG